GVRQPAQGAGPLDPRGAREGRPATAAPDPHDHLRHDRRHDPAGDRQRRRRRAAQRHGRGDHRRSDQLHLPRARRGAGRLLAGRPVHRVAAAQARPRGTGLRRGARCVSARRFPDGRIMRSPRILALALALFPLTSSGQAEDRSVEAISPPMTLADTPEGEIPDYGAPVLTLQEVLARAERPDGNLDLVQLREQLEQANNAVRRAWSNLLPQVTAALTYTRNSHSALIQFPNFAAGFITTPDG